MADQPAARVQMNAPEYFLKLDQEFDFGGSKLRVTIANPDGSDVAWVTFDKEFLSSFLAKALGEALAKVVKGEK